MIAYITDGHEAAMFGIAFGLFVVAAVVGISSLVSTPSRPLTKGFRIAGLAASVVFALVGFMAAGAWVTRSNAIFSGDKPPTSADVLPAGGGSSGSGGGGTPTDFCSTHTCVGDFNNESGYIVECGDGTYSHAGGLQGACSHHGGETGGAISTGSGSGTSGSPVGTVPTQTVPVYRPPPPPPASEPRLTGATSATSGGFGFSVKQLVPEKNLDQPGPPPSFGVGVMASCSEPDNSITTWRLSGAAPSYESGIASCFQGSINAGGIAVTFTVTGCGAHVLTVTPTGLSNNGTETQQAAPMRFPFRVCP